MTWTSRTSGAYRRCEYRFRFWPIPMFRLARWWAETYLVPESEHPQGMWLYGRLRSSGLLRLEVRDRD